MAGVGASGERCCRRLRGSTFELPLFHGLTPTAKCCRRFAAYWNPRGGAPGDHFLTLPLRGFLEPRADARGLFV